MSTKLYVKIHIHTKLKYFGKTIHNPFVYPGSGVYWARHIKKHGNDVLTLLIAEFEDDMECMEFALAFSKENKIKESNEWANLQDENGMDGAPQGHDSWVTEEGRKKCSIASKARWDDPEYREKLVQAHKDRWTDELRERQSNRLREEFWTEERRIAHSEKMSGRVASDEAKEKLSKVPRTEEWNRKNSEALKGKPKSEEHKKKLKEAAKKRKKRKCEHCGVDALPAHYARYHGVKCKSNTNTLF